MENAAEALKLAGSVLLFVLALSIIISSFSNVRETSDIIIDYKDRESEYQYYEYVDSSGNLIKERTVRLETVIPSIFRAYLENYKIVFEGVGFTPNDPIYKKRKNDGSSVSRNVLDLETDKFENVALASDEKKAQFISAILYGVTSTTFNTDFSEVELGTPLYSRLKDKKITEYLGVYYQDDNPDIPDVMKQQKRVITYKVE